MLTLLTTILFGTGARAATEVEIPTPSGTYINWENADLVKCNSENGGANVGSTGSQTVITFNIKNTVNQDYVMSFLTGAKGLTAELGVTLANDSKTYLDATANVQNTGSWTPSTPQIFIIKDLPVGSFTLTIKVNSTTSGYAGNYGDLAFTPMSNYDQIPGTIDINKGSYNGPRVENNTNVGYVTNNGTATYTFYNNTEGSYKLNMEIARYNQGGTLNINIKDNTTGKVEVNTDYAITEDAPGSYTATSIPLSGSLATGMKTMTFTFTNGNSFICNYQNVSMEYAGMLAEVTGVSIDGQEVKVGDSSDWLCQLPIDYSEATTTLGVAVSNGTVSLTAVDEEGSNVAVTANADGTFSLPTPDKGKTTTVTIALTAKEGSVASKATYTLKIFHIANVTLTAISVGGVDEPSLLDALNGDTHKATLSGKTFTTVPAIKATLIDGSTVSANGTANGSSATYSFKGTIGKTSQDYELSVEGLHLYTPEANDKTVDLKYSGAGKTDNGTWSNGLYTLTTTGLDGWENSSFKLNGTDYTLSLPANIKVKQIIFKDLKSNYQPSDGAGFTSVASEGATVYLPSKRDYNNTEASKYDLVVNIENHTAGTPITFSITGGGQPTAWLQLTTEEVAISSAPTLNSRSVTVNNNHAVVALTFDREMADVTAAISGQTVTAEGGSSTLYFSVWNLDWNSSNNLVIAAGSAKDTYGNGNASEISIPVTIGAQPTVEKAAYDYVVSTADEFKEAFAAVNASNNKADATRKVIFIKNGDYDFGSAEQRLTAYNVSLIGESRDGVILHGTRDGISNPVLNLRDRTGFYLQDLTVRNDKNYGLSDKGGVAVAIYGGNKTVMKNVRMLSNQDTQVTGERAYFEGCEIHGTVDFICGGGDNFYYNTALVLEDRGGNCITAPSTSALLKWGYVFQHCTISAMEGATQVKDGSYNLGRPWQNEPRANFLNTTMNVKPADKGWTSMSTLPTHFYEYNSTDANGKAIDLSVRGNSPTSTNTYTPVLTDEEAKKFTLENVLGGTDSWLPTEQTVVSGATTASINDNTISWTAVDNARAYVIFRDGKYVANQTETTYTPTEDGTYTIRTANLMGGLGETSNEVVYPVSTGIDTIAANTATNSNAPAFNLAGQRVGKSFHGIVIKNGKKTIQK